MPQGYSLPQIQTTATSAQAPPNLGLDIVDISAKSLIVGKMASKFAIQQAQFQTVKMGEVTAGGAISSNLLKLGGKGALVSGAVSAARNIYHLAKGEINVSRAGGNVGADILGGAVGGMVAATTAGLAVKALATKSLSAMGIGGIIAGTVGFALLDVGYRASGLRETVSNGITAVIERFFDPNPPPGGV